METTIGKLKIGATLVMGRYSVHTGADPVPVTWLKGTSNSDFITEFAVDYLPFDAMERGSEVNVHRYSGNPNYEVSNLLQFLNSDSEEWFTPMHQYDAPPTRDNVIDRYRSAYARHYGFLYLFEDYEIESIQNNGAERIGLPTFENFVGDDKFSIFRKKGVRARATSDFVMHKGVGFAETSYIPIWLSKGSRDFQDAAAIFSRNGSMEYQRPVLAGGVRPICQLRPDTIVVQDDDGAFRIKPRNVDANTCTDEDISKLLGLV